LELSTFLIISKGKWQLGYAGLIADVLLKSGLSHGRGADTHGNPPELCPLKIPPRPDKNYIRVSELCQVTSYGVFFERLKFFFFSKNFNLSKKISFEISHLTQFRNPDIISVRVWAGYAVDSFFVPLANTYF